MTGGPFRDFVVSYPFEGGQWSITIKAKDFADAEARKRALVHAKVDGELMAKLRSNALTMPFDAVAVRVATWWRNRGANPKSGDSE